VILGNSLHALPPNGGQRVNMAMEVRYCLALVLGHLKGRGAI
jgi:2-polyprenyl-6-methoxyphenol hydroxylase-like FAD-dependent oxidoreductase